jgi:hypothetical protein
METFAGTIRFFAFAETSHSGNGSETMPVAGAADF